MRTPKFKDPKKLRRSLQEDGIALSEIDVQRDVVDVEFGLKNRDNRPAYSLQITQWDENNFKIKMDFLDPGQVSRGDQRDTVELKFKNPNMFVSKATGLPMKPPKMVKTVPRQLPKGVSAEQVQAEADSAKNSFTAIVIIQLVLSVFLKGVLDDLWGIFLILQILAYLSLYKVEIPASVAMYVEGIRGIVTFKMLKPDPILGMLEPGLTLEALLGAAKGANTDLPQEMEEAGQTASFLVNMFIYVAAFGVFFIVLIVLVLLTQIKKWRSKIEAIVEGVKKKTFWNNAVRSVTISYIETAIQLKNKLGALKPGPDFAGGLGAVVGLSCYCVGYPAVVFGFLWKHDWKTFLDTKAQRERTEKMYFNIAGYRSLAKYYYPIFMFRRLLFVLIPAVFATSQTLQLQSLMLFSSLYLLWYGSISPYVTKRGTYVEMFNEVIMCVLCYHLFLFSDFTQYLDIF